MGSLWQGKTYLKMLLVSWRGLCQQKRFRYIQRGIVVICRLNDCKAPSYQNCRSEKNPAACSARIKPGGPGSSHGQLDVPQSLTDHNCAAFWPTETHSTSFERSDILSDQETSSLFRIGFALSKWPHFNSVYLLGVFTVFSATVKLDSVENLTFP